MQKARLHLASIGLLLPALVAVGSHSAAAADKGDTTFMIASTVMVLAMTIPGLALYYGGLVRTKNMLSVLVQVFATVCLVCIMWMLYGYSLAFTNGGDYNDFIGGFSKVLLTGITPASEVPTFSNGVKIPEYAYLCFQMTFAAITPALIVGAFAERMKFSAVLLFMLLWLTFVYCPIAHMVWYWPGPDALADAARSVAQASGAAKPAAEAILASTVKDAGLAFQWGAIDFAGGTVVHTNAGVAGLVCAVLIGPRLGYGREPMPPHSLSMSMIGASMLWVGWFGFNCGSNLEANGTAALAMANTFSATAAAALAWMFTEWLLLKKPTLLGLTTGAIAGLVAVTPASGFAHPIGAIILGVFAGFASFVFCTSVKSALKYDDSLDVFGVHCVAGIIGAIGTGLLVDPQLGGTGVADYISKPGEIVMGYDRAAQMLAQFKAIGVTLAWSGIGTALILIIVAMLTGLRPPPEAEREGLDINQHGERAYNY